MKLLTNAALRDTLDSQGIRLTQADYHSITGISLPDTWRWLHDHRGLAEPLVTWQPRYEHAVLAAVHGSLIPTPGARALVAALQADGIPLGLASSSQRAWVDATQETLGLSTAFDSITTAQEVASGKPAPDIYLRAAAKLRASPSQCLVFEDAPAGIHAARSAGMAVVAVVTAYNRGLDTPGAVARGPDFTSLTPAALRRLLGR